MAAFLSKLTPLRAARWGAEAAAVALVLNWILVRPWLRMMIVLSGMDQTYGDPFLQLKSLLLLYGPMVLALLVLLGVQPWMPLRGLRGLSVAVGLLLFSFGFVAAERDFWVAPMRGTTLFCTPLALAAAWAVYVWVRVAEARAPAAASVEPALSPSQIAGDLPCQRCGYNLRTLQAHQHCPECNTPVHETLRTQADIPRDTAFLRAVHHALTFVFCIYLANMVLGILFQPIVLRGLLVLVGKAGATRVYGGYLLANCMFMWGMVVGGWWITRPERPRMTLSAGPWLRWSLRIGVATWALFSTLAHLPKILVYLLGMKPPIPGTQGGGMVALILLAGTLHALPLFFNGPGLLYSHGLARRLQSSALGVWVVAGHLAAQAVNVFQNSWDTGLLLQWTYRGTSGSTRATDALHLGVFLFHLAVTSVTLLINIAFRRRIRMYLSASDATSPAFAPGERTGG